MRHQHILLALAGLTAWASLLRAAEDVAWQKTASTHFIVMHTGDETLAKAVSERAESYYSTIAADLGYTRYQNFWLWDKRVKILIYPTAEAFAAACDAPSWAAGRANAKKHEIASYKQSGEGFLSALLPHEMSHLILADFIGEENIPLWLTEGFAQWEESDRKSIPAMPASGQKFFLKDLVAMDIRREANRTRVGLFYAQSASVVGYLIKTCGGESFGKFCRALRDGKPVETALTTAFPRDVPTLETLGQKWLKAVTLPPEK